MAEGDDKRDFFVSYTRVDQSQAEWIAWVLEEAGYSVFVQAWDMLPGQDFVQRMNLGSQCGRTIAVLSPEYHNSDYCMAEWNAAVAVDTSGNKRKLIGVRIADYEPPGLQASRIYIDLVGRDEKSAKQELLAKVKDVARVKPEEHPPYTPRAKPVEQPSYQVARQGDDSTSSQLNPVRPNVTPPSAETTTKSNLPVLVTLSDVPKTHGDSPVVSLSDQSSSRVRSGFMKTISFLMLSALVLAILSLWIDPCPAVPPDLEKQIREASAAYKSKHTYDGDLSQGGRRLSVGEVLINNSADLTGLLDRMSKGQPRQGAVSVVVAAGGAGKGPVYDFLRGGAHAQRSGTQSKDLADLRGNTPAVTYVAVPGLINASLPSLPKVSEDPSPQDFEELVNPDPTIWSSTHTVLLDSYDEVAEATRRYVLKAASAWAKEHGEVVIFGRGEAFRDLLTDPVTRKLFGDDSAIIHLRPIWVGDGDPYYWFVGDYACHEQNKVPPEAGFKPEYCEKYKELKKWARDALPLKSFSKDELELLYTTEPANHLIEERLRKISASEDGSGPKVLIDSFFDRGHQRHGRPDKDDTGKWYRAALAKVAGQLPLKSGDPSILDDNIRSHSTEVATSHGTIPVDNYQLLEFSGFIEMAPPNGFAVEVNFFPPLVQLFLAENSPRTLETCVPFRGFLLSTWQAWFGSKRAQ